MRAEERSWRLPEPLSLDRLGSEERQELIRGISLIAKV